jgi:hypothetical protein
MPNSRKNKTPPLAPSRPSRHRPGTQAIGSQAADHAKKFHQLTAARLQEAQGLPIEALDSIRVLADARQAEIDAVIDYNIAQHRLFAATASSPPSSQQCGLNGGNFNPKTGSCIRLIAWLPLDVAAAARIGPGQWLLSGKHPPQRFTEIPAMRLLAAPRAGIVELPRVKKLPLAVEQEKIRGAGRAVGLGHLLAFIDQIGEIPAPRRREMLHRSWSVLWIPFQIIGIDRHRVDSLFRDFPRQISQRVGKMHNEGTMVAGENHQQTARTRHLFTRNDFTIRVWQRKSGRGVSGAELER